MSVTQEEERVRRMNWWLEARVGLFLHWGPSSVSGKEISWARAGHPFDSPGGSREVPDADYDALYKLFNPVKFDANEWMTLAKDAGMKYVVFTTKHHDGFSMWPTRLSDYNITQTPFKRDVCAELAAAAHTHGLKLGWYYSTRDWFHPDYLRGGNAKYNDFYHGQLRELLTNYGKVDLLWFDHVAGNWSDYRFAELFAMINELQPGIIVNNRAAAFVTKPDDQPSQEIRELVRGDYDTPEQTVGKFQNHRPWESCITMTDCEDGGGWSYRPDGRTRGAAECLKILRDCATGDGNLLLNVGPLPSGEIAADQQTALRRLGAWLQNHGDSVHGTRGGPFRNGAWGGSTYRGNTIYLHPTTGVGPKLSLPPPRARVVSSSAKVEQTADGLLVSLPPDRRDAPVKLELDAPAAAEFRDGEPLEVVELRPPQRVWTFDDLADVQVLGGAEAKPGLELELKSAARLRLLGCGGLKPGRRYEATFRCLASEFMKLRLGDTGRDVQIGPFWHELTLCFAAGRDGDDAVEFPLASPGAPATLRFGPVSLRELPEPPPFARDWSVEAGAVKLVTGLQEGELDLGSLTGTFKEKDVASLRNQFSLPAARWARFTAAADFWLKLRHNDEIILDTQGGQLGDHVLELLLPAGRNVFEAEVRAGSRGWRFLCGAPDPNLARSRWAGPQ